MLLLQRRDKAFRFTRNPVCLSGRQAVWFMQSLLTTVRFHFPSFSLPPILARLSLQQRFPSNSHKYSIMRKKEEGGRGRRWEQEESFFLLHARGAFLYPLFAFNQKIENLSGRAASAAACCLLVPPSLLTFCSRTEKNWRGYNLTSSSRREASKKISEIFSFFFENKIIPFLDC